MSNQAAWITEAKANPLEVKAADLWKAGPGEVLIKNAAWAVNPVDWKVQDYGVIFQKYPNILGEDSAGEIYEVGEGVTSLKKGQRVLAWGFSLATSEPRDGAFQLYSIANEKNVSPIPDSVSFEQAAVLPEGISTAAAALYQKDYLALPYPVKDTKPLEKTILISGGSSSVGAAAIQLARASGLTVFATASSHNHSFVKSIGATKAFDYRQGGIADEIAAALKGSDFVGIFDAVSTTESYTIDQELLSKLGGGTIISTLPPNGVTLPDNIKHKNVMATTIASEEPEVRDAVWQKYLPGALESGQLQAKPDPILIKGGLEKIQDGLDRQKKGVSAGKVVVTS